MSRLLLLAAFVTIALTVVSACNSSESEPVADAGADAMRSTNGREDAGAKGVKDAGTIVCHCPGSCGIPDKDVEWPADLGCNRGACDGISNCVDADAADGN